MAADHLEQPHHDGAALHVPEEEPRAGTSVDVFVRVPHGDGANQVWVRTMQDAEPRFHDAVVDRTTAGETWWRCTMPTHNPVTNYRFLLHGGPRGYRWLNGTGTHARDVTDADDFRITTAGPRRGGPATRSSTRSSPTGSLAPTPRAAGRCRRGRCRRPGTTR